MERDATEGQGGLRVGAAKQLLPAVWAATLGASCSGGSEAGGVSPQEQAVGHSVVSVVRLAESPERAVDAPGLELETFDFTGYCRLEVELTESRDCTSAIRHRRGLLSKTISYRTVRVTGEGESWVITEFDPAEDWTLSKSLSFNGQVVEGLHFRLTASGDVVVLSGPEGRPPKFKERELGSSGSD